MYHILNNIFLSNLRDARNMKLIRANNIQIVVRLSRNNNASIYPTNIAFHNFQIEDSCSFKAELIDYSKFIRGIIDNNPDKNILIHCNEGRSRSASVIIFYLMTKHKLSFDQSWDYIKTIKSDIRPNDGFEQVLRTFG